MLKNISLKHIGIAILILKFSLISYLILTVLPTLQWHDVQPDFSFLGFVVVGFIAQIIDGTLGMAYGVSCTTFLLNLGVAPKLASAAVHTAEVFTTGVSGLSHIKYWKLCILTTHHLNRLHLLRVFCMILVKLIQNSKTG